MAYHYKAGYTFVEEQGSYYSIGYTKIQSAVYENVENNEWVAVIYRSLAEPFEVYMPGIFSIMYKCETKTIYQNMYSDIDDCTIGFYQGAYIYSTNFEMEQASPSTLSSLSSYTASTQTGLSETVSGTVEYSLGELTLESDHSFANNVFDIDYIYHEITIDSIIDDSYMTSISYNKGTYLVDMSVPNSSTAGTFVNHVILTTEFKSKGFSVSTTGIKSQKTQSITNE